MELILVPALFVIAGLFLYGWENAPRGARWLSRVAGLSGVVARLRGGRDAAGVKTDAYPLADLLIGGRRVKRRRLERRTLADGAHPDGVALECVRELWVDRAPDHPGYSRQHATAAHLGLVERLGAGLHAWHDDQIVHRLPADATDRDERMVGARLVALDMALGGRADALWPWLAAPGGRCADARAQLLLEEAPRSQPGQAAARRLADHPAPTLRALAALARRDGPALVALATGAMAPELRVRVVQAIAAEAPGALGAVLRQVPLKHRSVRAATLAAVSSLSVEDARHVLARLWRAAEPDEWPPVLAELVARDVGVKQAWEALAASDGRVRRTGGEALWALLGDEAEAAALRRLAAGGALTLGLCEALSRKGSVAAIPPLVEVKSLGWSAAEAAEWAIADIQERAAGAPGGLALAQEGGALTLVYEEPEA